MRFIIPPGNLAETSYSHLFHNNNNKESSSSSSSTSVAAQALKALNIVPSENKNDQQQQTENNEGDNNQQPPAPKGLVGQLNAAEMSDEEITQALSILPKYADLASSRLRHAAGLRAHARHNYGAASAIHRAAIWNLKQHVYKCGLSDNLPELEQMSLQELRERYGETEQVKKFLTKWRDSFTIDVDKLYDE